MMDTESQAPIPKPNEMLQILLYPVAKRLRNIARRKIRCTALLRALIFCALIAALSFYFPLVADFSLVSIFTVLAAFLIHSARVESRIKLDYRAAARQIESENAELKQSLITAVEEQLRGDPSFFSDLVVSKALQAPSRPVWRNAAKIESRKSFVAYAVHLWAISLCLLASYAATNLPTATNGGKNNQVQLNGELIVEPGNQEIERGSSLVITARFEGALPQDVSLEVLNDGGEIQVFPMSKSLSDPIFAYSLRSIENPLNYRILYSDYEGDSYRISTYDLPDLLQADADLDFPEYTEWEDRRIEDTLRISAIEGTQLSYRFNTNKPVQSAYLQNRQGERLELAPTNEDGMQFQLNTTLQTSARYTLHLTDEAGRVNPYPPEVRIETILNQRPSLSLSSPRGDQRFSALEEVQFTGTATDDFGIQDFGIAFVLPGKEQEETSLASEGFTTGSLSEQIDHLLRLEELQLEAKDTLSWYLWADDFGPDGEVRRSTGDLYFADVRNFDEIFREQDQGGGGQGGAGGQGTELLEKQRRIAISLFRIKNSATDVDAAIADIDTIQLSQIEALDELQQLIPELQEPSAREHATEAQRFMEGVNVGLNNTVDTPSLQPLDLAWSDAQSAYDRLVKLSDDEYNVGRSQNQSGGGGGGQSRSQSQINELEFRQDDSRYETASEAQALSSPEDRQNLELISKLNELSRRQDDMNERLQEIQSELANAETEEAREEIRRELKRLEEEQRQMLADADEAIQQAGNRQSARKAREQMEEARENMQQASEQLEGGEVSQALASGSRAQDTLDRTREQLREANSSQFSEAMREARAQAKELAETQENLQDQLSDLIDGPQRTLDDSDDREELAQNIEQQSEKLESLLNELKEVAESSENVEPGLFRDLYQVLRDSNGSRFDERYENSAQYLRQGFIEDAVQGQNGLSRDIESLSEAIAEAADGILGSESATLNFAQSEIDSLSEQLEQERPTQESSGAPQAGGGSMQERLRSTLAGFGGSSNGPLTGGDFENWIDRLSTVESLISEPLARARVTEARETAENMRRDFKRRSEVPQWEMIVEDIAAPLNEVSSWLANELNRIESPETLQAIDRDPVPEEYDRIVQKYYESLGDE